MTEKGDNDRVGEQRQIRGNCDSGGTNTDQGNSDRVGGQRQIRGTMTE